MGKVKVQRHSLWFRCLHWAIFIMGAFLTLTGMQRGGILGITVFPSNTFSYHVTVGIMFMAAAILAGFELVFSGTYSWMAIRRIPLSLRYIGNETRTWFGFIAPPTEETIRYDPARRSYIEKLIPSSIVVWWTFVVMGWALVLTGVTLAFPQLNFLYLISDPIGVALVGYGGYAFLLVIHRFVALALVILVVMHIYSAFVFGLVPAMIHGYREEAASNS